MLDLMIHDFDYARWISGEVESVFAKNVSTLHPDAATEYGMAILKHTSGALSHVVGGVGLSTADVPHALRDCGRWRADRVEFGQHRADQTCSCAKTTPTAPDVGLPGSPVAKAPTPPRSKSSTRALKTDRAVRVSAADGLAAVQIALAAIESAQTGQPIQITPLAGGGR